MLQLNRDHLTETEKGMYDILSETVKTKPVLRITEAADLCKVSPSKVTKFIQKLGFKSFKQFKLYFSGDEIESATLDKSTEISRLIDYLNNFDYSVVEEFITIINNYSKIIIYGLGPSFFTAEYFGHKLATVMNKNITVTQFEDYATQLADKDTLLLVFSVTGKFASFDQLFDKVHRNQADSMLIMEEYMNASDYNADYIFHLTEGRQNDDLLPFEKTRTIFFIFIEEIFKSLQRKK